MVKRSSNQEHEVICLCCGTKFIGKHNNAKYCSDKCRRIMFRKCMNKYTARNRDKCRKRYRDYYDKNSEYVLSKTEEYRKTEKGKLVKKKAEENKKAKFPEKVKAKTIIRNLIASGRLTRQPCEICSSTNNIQAHHDDYSKPTEVRWLCVKCHSSYHKELRRNSERYAA